jgi:hypothetical protein
MHDAIVQMAGLRRAEGASFVQGVHGTPEERFHAAWSLLHFK